MQMPSASFNPQMTSADIQRASFVTRLYGLHNNRGPYFYPQSPYAIMPQIASDNGGMGDIAPMAAMQPITQETLFTQLPTSGLIATSTAPIGSAGFPTFTASAPPTQGTILGPAGTTVPSLSPLSTSNLGTGGSVTPGNAVPQVPAALSYTSPYGLTPSPTLENAQTTGQPAGPITFMNPWPSIIQPPPQVAAATSAPSSALSQLGCWVNQNPGLAFLGTVGLYLLLKGGKKR